MISEEELRGVPQESSVNVIMIGLGGAGSQIVDHVAMHLKDFYRGELPRHIRIICVDRDPASLNAVKHVETYRLAIDGTEASIRIANPGIPLGVIRDCIQVSVQGLGMRRCCAAVLYNAKEGDITGWLRSIADDLHRRTGNNAFLVVIVSSFGGGTGSGLMPLIANCAYETLTASGYIVAVMGIGTLPDPHDLDIHFANAYGLLKELSLLQTLREGISLRTQTGVSRYLNPFSAFVLLGMTSREGRSIKEDVSKAVAHFLIDLGYIVPSRERIGGSIADKLLDLSDLQSLALDARNKFVTINYFEVYLPVPLLEWMFNFEELGPKLRGEIERMRSEISGLEERLREMESTLRDKLANLRELKDKISDELKKDIPRMAKVKYDDSLRRIEEIERKLIDTRNSVSFYREQLNDLKSNLNSMERRLGELENRYDEGMRYLMSPTSSRIEWKIPLSKEEIERLRELHRRGELRRLSLKEILINLGRAGTYENLILGMGSQAAQSPYLLNYDVVPPEDNPLTSDNEVAEELLRRGFLERRGGGIVEPLRGGERYAALISSREENIPPEMISGEGWVNAVTRLARGGLLRIVKSDFRKHSFAVYFLATGIRVMPPVAGLRALLRDVERMESDYRRISMEKGLDGLACRHSLFMGRAMEVINQLGLTVRSEADPNEAYESLVKFYESYIPMSPDELIMLTAYMAASSKIWGRRVVDYMNSLLQTTGRMSIDEGTNPLAIEYRINEFLEQLNNLNETTNNFEELVSSYIDLTERILYCEFILRNVVRLQGISAEHPLIDLIEDAITQFDLLMRELSLNNANSLLSRFRGETLGKLEDIDAMLDKILGRGTESSDWMSSIRRIRRRLPEVRRRFEGLAERLGRLADNLVRLQRNFQEIEDIIITQHEEVEERRRGGGKGG